MNGSDDAMRGHWSRVVPWLLGSTNVHFCVPEFASERETSTPFTLPGRHAKIYSYSVWLLCDVAFTTQKDGHANNNGDETQWLAAI